MTIRTAYTYSGVLLTPAPGTTTLALTTNQPAPIEYLERSHIEVWRSTDGFVANETQLVRPTQFDISVDGTEVELVTPTSSGQSYVLRRVTPLTDGLEFADGTNLTENQLNRVALVSLYQSQEAQDGNIGFQDGLDGLDDDVAAALSASSSAQSTANTAQSTATAAQSTANAALTAVSGVLPFTLVANVAALPGSSTNGAVFEVTNSTGIESLTPLAGLPGGFVGSSGLSVRIAWSTSPARWNWRSYFANDPETRYVATAGTGLTKTGSTLALSSGSQTSLGLAGTSVQPARAINTGPGIGGGGNLSADRNLTLTWADQSQAETGTSDVTVMSPLRTAQQVAAKPPGIPVSAKTSAYSLVDADTGKTISITTGGVTVPSTLAIGTTVSIFNNSAAVQTITQGGGLTMYLAQSGATGNRTLAGRGWCTVSKITASVAVIAGAGLS